MLKDKEFFSELISILKEKRYYDSSIWSFAFYHGDVALIREIIALQNARKPASPPLFEYYPYYSSRAHLFASESKSTIRNVEFKETYTKFLLQSALGIQNKGEYILGSSYYLILQDRVPEAQELIKSLNEKEYLENEIQFDYIRCYIDMSLNYPNFSSARKIVNKYTNYPL